MSTTGRCDIRRKCIGHTDGLLRTIIHTWLRSAGAKGCRILIHRIYSTPSVVFFFFFQAEDGIRDIGVTGVQTCALPIWTSAPLTVSFIRFLLANLQLSKFRDQATPVAAAGTAARAAQSCVRKSRATFSAIAMVVSMVTLDGGVGMIDASATLRLETPSTAPVASTTACGSLRGPMRTVPVAWL